MTITTSKSSLAICGLTVVWGEEMQILKDGFIGIDVERGVIVEVAPGRPSSRYATTIEGGGAVALPAFINAHTHIADAAFRDAYRGGVVQSVHPTMGIKARLLASVGRRELLEAIRETAGEMVKAGTALFADFREGGLDGVRLLHEAIHGLPIDCLVLGQPELYDLEPGPRWRAEIGMLRELLSLCHGFGLSGPNEYADETLQMLGELAREMGKLVAIHAAEDDDSYRRSVERYGQSEVERIARWLRPHIIIHMTRATPGDLALAREMGAGVVVCPRSNARLGAGIPDIVAMKRAGLRVALGTDNVMLCEPDMFREMEYTLSAVRGHYRDPQALTPREVLEMATIEAARVLGVDRERGSIEVGKAADLVFLDPGSIRLRTSRDLLASIVTRAGREDILCVMKGGRVVYGGFQ